MNKDGSFSSRIGFFISTLGIAIGVGNIWRFPRMVAQNGCGSFLIPWFIFLLTWSIPLIVAEASFGKKAKAGPVLALGQELNPKKSLFGLFIAASILFIMSYYAVIVGWGARYFLYSLSGELTSSINNPEKIWSNFISYKTIFWSCSALLLGAKIVSVGIKKGIEKTNKILMPFLFLTIAVMFIKSISMAGSSIGLKAFFTPNLKDLLNYKLWLEALTQNAWDTGAGWGLVLVYAGYAQTKTNVIKESSLAAILNNVFSLLMGVIIFCSATGIDPINGIEHLVHGDAKSDVGLSFIYLPKLFNHMFDKALYSALFSSLFFISFTSAAFSSLISMIKLVSQVFEEFGCKKNTSILITAVLGCLISIPSSVNINFLRNQDYVWGMALLVNGVIISLASYKSGIFSSNINSELHLKKTKSKLLSNLILRFIIPFQGIILLFSHVITSLFNIKKDINLWSFAPISLIIQWSILIIVILINKKIIIRKTIETILKIKKNHNF